MPERVLITGAGGFVGRYLADYLLTQNYRLSGTFIPIDDNENLTYLSKNVELIECDITDYDSVHDLIERVQPDHLYHLAAQSHVPNSWKNPTLTITVNVLGTLNIINAIQQIGCVTRILSITSAEVYGPCSPDQLPITEETPLKPNNPYAISKLTQDLLSQQLAKARNQPIIVVRPFSHTGPFQIPSFVCPAFAKQIAAIHLGLEEPVLKVGSLDASRDFTDVRDMVRAYHLAMTHGNSGEAYNICTGEALKIQWILDTLLSFTDQDIMVITDQEKLRPTQVPILYGDSSKFRTLTGWKPEIPFTQTLKDIFTYWIETLQSKVQ